MDAFEPPRTPPAERDAAEMVVAEPLDLTFEGFDRRAFEVLERLRQHPHVEQYRTEKEAIRRYITEPFKRYRDDLVVNWVLPNRLDFETERNVFSRLLKNDFGAGGCHHHLWMSFYRPGRRRLTDFQLAHSLSPDGLSVGLYVGDYAQDLVRHAAARIEADPEQFVRILRAILREDGWKAFYYEGRDGTRREIDRDVSLSGTAWKPQRLTGLWVRTVHPRDAVLARGGELVGHALRDVVRVWTLYRFLAAGS